MVGGAVTDGHLIGDLIAFGMTVCMAIMMLILRRQQATPMLPAACLSALLCPLAVWPFGAPLAVDAGDMLNLFLFGTTQFGLGSGVADPGRSMGLGDRECPAQHAGGAARHRVGVAMLRRDAVRHQSDRRRYRRGGRGRTGLVRDPVQAQAAAAICAVAADPFGAAGAGAESGLNRNVFCAGRLPWRPGRIVRSAA